ncbi:hypothetical protein LJR027_003660 [Terrabacter sp. LjRoot27]|uniref:hypothetical protein n=1 Tax=Terrabacter sp. LjRoot27 TaxID=3342306 RepID=UPI003ECCCE8E
MARRFGRRRQVFLFLAAVGIGLIAPAVIDGAAAADAPTTPQLVILDADGVTFKVKSSDFLEYGNPVAAATASIVLSNSGLDAQQVRVRAFMPDGTERPVVTNPPTHRVVMGQVLAVPLTMEVRPSDPASGLLVVEDAATADPVAKTTFGIRRSVALWVLLKPIWGGLAAALIIFALLFAVLRAQHNDVRMGRHLRAGSDWKFNESWASNIGAAGALVAAVAGASGQLSQLLPQFPAAQLVGVNLFLGFLVLLAPVAYLTFKDGNEGTIGGLMLGGLLSLWAALGQIVSVVLLLGRSGVSSGLRLGLGVMAILVVVLIAAYVWRSVFSLVAGGTHRASRSTAIM